MIVLKNKISVIVACTMALCLCGCNGSSDEEVVSDNEISEVSVESDIAESAEQLIDRYFQAIKEHNHQQMVECTTSDYSMNYDQTGFEEFVRYITDYTVYDTDFSSVGSNDDTFTVAVKYMLEYSDEYVEQNSESGGNYSYYDDFVIEKDDSGEYRISSVEHKGAG